MALCIVSGCNHHLSEEELSNGYLRGKLVDCSLLIFIRVSKKREKAEFTWQLASLAREIKTISASSTIDAIFKLKKNLDEAKIVECLIYAPEANVQELTAVKELLFVDIFEVKVQAFPAVDPLTKWEFSESADYTAVVKQYLTEVASREDVKVIKSNLMPSDLFVHGYSTRYGGISFYPSQASLNMIYSQKKTDSRLVIEENRRRLCYHLGRDPTRFHIAKAVHGKNVWVYEKLAPETYDGIITKTPGVTVACPAADCNMLLLADPVKKACGAIHAGWKGILLEIPKCAVQEMVQEYGSDPKTILCSLGPSLSVCCCEFGAEESKKFLPIHEDVVVWKKDAPKPFLDLRLAVTIQLLSCGIKPENIDAGTNGTKPSAVLATCTKCDPNEDYFSYRRDGPRFGNCAGFISLK